MKPALVIVDIQNDYFPGGRMELVNMDAAANHAQQVLKSSRAKGFPVFHIQHLSNQPGATFFLPGTEGVQIHKSVTPRSGEPVVQKHFPNAFRDTPLLERLKGIQVEDLIVCGAMTHMCIDTTVRAAFDLGFNCLVVSDACATKNMEHGGVAVKAPQVHAAFMASLSSAFAKVVRTAELEDHLR